MVIVVVADFCCSTYRNSETAPWADGEPGESREMLDTATWGGKLMPPILGTRFALHLADAVARPPARPAQKSTSCLEGYRYTSYTQRLH